MIVAWNIVTGTFLQQAMRYAQPDLDRQVYEGLKERRRLSRHLNGIFEDAVGCVDGTISLTQLRSKLNEDVKLRFKLANLGLDVDEHFLEILGSFTEGKEEEKRVNIKTLVNASVRMRGYATSVDLHELSYRHDHLRYTTDRLGIRFNHVIPIIEDIAARLGVPHNIRSPGSSTRSPTRHASRPGRPELPIWASQPEVPPGTADPGDPMCSLSI